jgi:tRNA threonylcarbamoyladenosine biosynthesis protein TsaB
LFQETGLDLGEVDLFAAVIGPGSFTGLRVSLACVRGLASEKPCFGGVASDVAAWAARGRGRNILALTDLFHGEIFGGLYNASGDLTGARESGLLEPVMEALRPHASNSPLLIGSAAVRHKDELARCFPQGVFVELPEGLAPHLAHLASVRANEETTCRASDLLPFYLRDPLTRGLPPAARQA